MNSLIHAAESEMFQFDLNEHSYTIDQLIKLGLSNIIPNLIKLNKKSKGTTKIINAGGMPILKFNNAMIETK